jgi:hypothetical protein
LLRWPDSGKKRVLTRCQRSQINGSRQKTVKFHGTRPEVVIVLVIPPKAMVMALAIHLEALVLRQEAQTLTSRAIYLEALVLRQEALKYIARTIHQKALVIHQEALKIRGPVPGPGRDGVSSLDVPHEVAKIGTIGPLKSRIETNALGILIGQCRRRKLLIMATMKNRDGRKSLQALTAKPT